MNSSSRRLPRSIRAAFFILGVLTMFWLPLVETGVRNPQALALLAGLLVGIAIWVRSSGTPRGPQLLRSTGIGGLAGLLVAPLAVFLMIFKSGLHSHGFPDYSPEQIMSVLGRLPWWAAAGTAAGLLAGLVERGRVRQG